MNLFTSHFFTRTTGFIVLLVCSTFTGFSQGPKSIGYGLFSCYHALIPNNTGQPLNVLNVGTFHFDYAQNAGVQPDFIRVRLYDDKGEFIGYEYEHMGLGDEMYNVTRHPDYGMLVAVHGLDVWKEKWLVNKNEFIFSDYVGSVEITTYHWTGDEGSRTLDPSLYQLKLNLVSAEEAFKPNSNNAPCLTFDNFDLGIDHILNGFCGRLANASISLAPPVPVGSGWTSQFNQNTPMNTPLTINQPVHTNGQSWCENECTGVSAPAHVIEPISCGCVDFTLKCTLLPCTDADANCPEVEIELPLTICCDCDVRESYPQN